MGRHTEQHHLTTGCVHDMLRHDMKCMFEHLFWYLFCVVMSCDMGFAFSLESVEFTGRDVRCWHILSFWSSIIYNLCLYPYLGTVQSSSSIILKAGLLLSCRWIYNPCQHLSAYRKSVTTHKWNWFGCVGSLVDWLPWSEKWTWGQRKSESWVVFAERAVINPAVVLLAGHRQKETQSCKRRQNISLLIQLHLIRFCLLVQKRGGNSWRWELQTEASRKH